MVALWLKKTKVFGRHLFGLMRVVSVHSLREACGGGSFDEVDVAPSSWFWNAFHQKCHDFFQELGGWSRGNSLKKLMSSTFRLPEGLVDMKLVAFQLLQGLSKSPKTSQDSTRLGEKQNPRLNSTGVYACASWTCNTACSYRFSPHSFKLLTPKPGVEHATFAIASFRHFLRNPQVIRVMGYDSGNITYLSEDFGCI